MLWKIGLVNHSVPHSKPTQPSLLSVKPITEVMPLLPEPNLSTPVVSMSNLKKPKTWTESTQMKKSLVISLLNKEDAKDYPLVLLLKIMTIVGNKSVFLKHSKMFH
jgi:hypothetical protein